MYPGVIKAVGSTVDVRIFPDACTTTGGLAGHDACTANGRDPGEFPVFLKGEAEASLKGCSLQTNAIYGLEMFAAAAAIQVLGGQLRAKRMMLFIGNNVPGGGKGGTNYSSFLEL